MRALLAVLVLSVTAFAQPIPPSRNFGSTTITPRVTTSPVANGDVFDDFNRSNRTLNGDTAVSGQVWQLTGAAQSTATISSGYFVSASGNVYAYLPLASVTRIQGRWGTPASTSGQSATLIMDNITATPVGNLTGALANMIHLTFNESTWSLTKWISGTPTNPSSCSPACNGTYNLRIDGTQYPVSMSLSGSTVTLNLPDGSMATATDSAFGSTLVPQSVAWQLSAGGPSQWGDIRATASLKETSMPIMTPWAPMSEVAELKGTAGYYQQYGLWTFPATSGWYRIATGGNFRTFATTGHVRISAIDAFVMQVWEFDLATISTGTPVISQTYGLTTGAIFDQARLSTSTGVGTALDIHLQTGRATTVYAEIVGVNTVVANGLLSAGATALPTANALLTYVDSATGVSAIGTSASHASCWNGTVLSYCTSIVAVDGTCTCH